MIGECSHDAFSTSAMISRSFLKTTWICFNGMAPTLVQLEARERNLKCPTLSPNPREYITRQPHLTLTLSSTQRPAQTQSSLKPKPPLHGTKDSDKQHSPSSQRQISRGEHDYMQQTPAAVVSLAFPKSWEPFSATIHHSSSGQTLTKYAPAGSRSQRMCVDVVCVR